MNKELLKCLNIIKEWVEKYAKVTDTFHYENQFIIRYKDSQPFFEDLIQPTFNELKEYEDYIDINNVKVRSERELGGVGRISIPLK